MMSASELYERRTEYRELSGDCWVVARRKSVRKDEHDNEIEIFEVRVESRILIESLHSVRVPGHDFGGGPLPHASGGGDDPIPP